MVFQVLIHASRNQAEARGGATSTHNLSRGFVVGRPGQASWEDTGEGRDLFAWGLENRVSTTASTRPHEGEGDD